MTFEEMTFKEKARSYLKETIYFDATIDKLMEVIQKEKPERENLNKLEMVAQPKKTDSIFLLTTSNILIMKTGDLIGYVVIM